MSKIAVTPLCLNPWTVMSAAGFWRDLGTWGSRACLAVLTCMDERFVRDSGRCESLGAEVVPLRRHVIVAE
jgi:hypothetical protein